MKIVFTNSLLHWDHHVNRKKKLTHTHRLATRRGLLRTKWQMQRSHVLFVVKFDEAARYLPGGARWCARRWGATRRRGRGHHEVMPAQSAGRLAVSWAQHLALKWGWKLTKSVWLQMSAKKEGNRVLVLPSLDFLWLVHGETRQYVKYVGHAVGVVRCAGPRWSCQGWLRTSAAACVHKNGRIRIVLDMH